MEKQIEQLKELLISCEKVLKRAQCALPSDRKWDSLAQGIANKRGDINSILGITDEDIEKREIRLPIIEENSNISIDEKNITAGELVSILREKIETAGENVPIFQSVVGNLRTTSYPEH